MNQLLVLKLPSKKIVRFTGKFADNDPNFILLVKALFDYNFMIQAVINDHLVYSWLEWIHWIIIRTDQTVIFNQCDELWFTATTLPDEVTYPPRQGRATFCYVAGHLNVDDVDAFMCRSKHQWALL
jgi:hypothetical protein